MSIQEIHTYLQQDLDRVEACMEASLRSDIGLLDRINRR